MLQGEETRDCAVIKYQCMVAQMWLSDGYHTQGRVSTYKKLSSVAVNGSRGRHGYWARGYDLRQRITELRRVCLFEGSKERVRVGRFECLIHWSCVC